MWRLQCRIMSPPGRSLRFNSYVIPYEREMLTTPVFPSLTSYVSSMLMKIPKRFHTTFRGRSSLVRTNVLTFFLIINSGSLFGFLETFGEECLTLFRNVMNICCGTIGIIGIVSILIILSFRKRKRDKK